MTGGPLHLTFLVKVISKGQKENLLYHFSSLKTIPSFLQEEIPHRIPQFEIVKRRNLRRKSKYQTSKEPPDTPTRKTHPNELSTLKYLRFVFSSIYVEYSIYCKIQITIYYLWRSVYASDCLHFAKVGKKINLLMYKRPICHCQYLWNVQWSVTLMVMFDVMAILGSPCLQDPLATHKSYLTSIH